MASSEVILNSVSVGSAAGAIFVSEHASNASPPSDSAWIRDSGTPLLATVGQFPFWLSEMIFSYAFRLSGYSDRLNRGWSTVNKHGMRFGSERSYFWWSGWEMGVGRPWSELSKTWREVSRVCELKLTSRLLNPSVCSMKF